MKKYLVIGNPIEHSLSPKLHNYWIKNNNLNAVYEKKKLNTNELEDTIFQLKDRKIEGINVTVPFKKDVIPYLDELSKEAQITQSVNTIYFDKEKIVGHNTDIDGFELGIRDMKIDLSNKDVFLIGAGGVVPSIIFALNKMKINKIFVCNRTKKKAEDLKNIFQNLIIVDWGEVPNFDIVINATSVGLKNDDEINLDFSKIKSGKFFYDIIYNPPETNFLKKGKDLGNKCENGKRMFIYQAAAAFKLWHGIEPQINEDVIKLLD